MKIKAAAADLQMEGFAVTHLALDWIPRENEAEEEIDFQKYNIEIEMDLRSNSLEGDEFFYAMEIQINHGKKKLPGYQIRVAAHALFRIQDVESKDEVTLNNFRVISPTSLMINSLRSVISNTTSYSVFGRYNLPAIDILALINEKSKQTAKKQKAKQKTAK